MITIKGYKIPLESDNISDYKKELTVCPFNDGYTDKYPLFRISDKSMYLPKYYGINKLGIPEKIKEQNGLDVTFNFTGSLRDYQVDVSNKILSHIIKNGSGIASLYTGWGKTCAALWIASKIGKKTLIIVHTENLLYQWKERIQQFLGIEAGIIQGPTIEIENKDIVIGMIQSMSMKTYEPDTFKDFGLSLYDEAHHTPCKTFCRVFYKICTKYNLALSATITRSDGLTKVIH